MVMHKHVWIISLLMGLFACAQSNQAQRSQFTVKDSIEMSHFSEPNELSPEPPTWKVSPDGSMTIVVTTKGLVDSNLVESTLSLVDMQAVTNFLKTGKGSKPTPKPILKATGQLLEFQPNSYGSLLTGSKWSSDSKAIYVLVERKGGRQLCKVDVVTGHEETLSPEGLNVTNFDVDSRGVLYSAMKTSESAKGQETKTQDVIENARDISLLELLWPSSRREGLLFRSDRNGTRPIAPTKEYGTEKLFFISPGGTKVIALVPVEAPPAEWGAYITDSTGSGSLVQPKGSLFPTLEYELIDLVTGSRKPLLGSPSGRTKYADHAKVAWSSSGEHVIVTNTFLPTGGQNTTEQQERRHPCAAAYVGIKSGVSSCIAYARSSRSGNTADRWELLDAGFGRTEHEAVLYLRSWLADKHKVECYSLGHNGWTLDHTLGDEGWLLNPATVCSEDTETRAVKPKPVVRLRVVQGLDTSASLWAEDIESSHQLQIWQPNPQLVTKISGTTSIYHWTDKDSRKWSGLLLLPEQPHSGVRLPLVIQTHGYSPTRFFVNGPWPTATAARPLAAAGFAVLQVEDKTDQYGSLDELRTNVEGYGAAIDALAQSGVIDPGRVGIIGFSRTCWYVEESLIDHPLRFAAAVMADGIDQSYWQTLMLRPNTDSSEAEHQYASLPFGDGLQTWSRLAPGFRLSAVQTPLRIQAIEPASVLTEWETYASLRIQKKPVDLLYLPVGQHVLQNPAELMASEQGDVDWFRYWLQGEQDQDPAKREQYARWNSLRRSAPK